MAKSSSALPVRKVAIGGATGLVATVALCGLKAYLGDLPPEVASAITTVASFVMSYLTPPASGEIKEDKPEKAA